jgi:hypothetical protein
VGKARRRPAGRVPLRGSGSGGEGLWRDEDPDAHDRGVVLWDEASRQRRVLPPQHHTRAIPMTTRKRSGECAQSDRQCRCSMTLEKARGQGGMLRECTATARKPVPSPRAGGQQLRGPRHLGPAVMVSAASRNRPRSAPPSRVAARHGRPTPTIARDQPR